jgi:excisionase family DNA binding protein
MVLHSKPPLEAANSARVSETWSNQPLLTLKQAAHYTVCTPRYLQKQIRAGRLRALKPTGKLVRIRRSDLEKFLESGATTGGAE